MRTISLLALALAAIALWTWAALRGPSGGPDWADTVVTTDACAPDQVIETCLVMVAGSEWRAHGPHPRPIHHGALTLLEVAPLEGTLARTLVIDAHIVTAPQVEALLLRAGYSERPATAMGCARWATPGKPGEYVLCASDFEVRLSWLADERSSSTAATDVWRRVVELAIAGTEEGRQRPPKQ